MEYNFYEIYNSLEDIEESLIDPYPTNTLDKSCKELEVALNNFFTDFRCKEVICNPNTDNQFFGIFVKPCGYTYEESCRKILKGFYSDTSVNDTGDLDIIPEYEDFKYTCYRIEIDGRMFRDFNFTYKELWAIMLREINILNSSEPTTKLRNIIDAYISLNNTHLDIQLIESMSTIFNMVTNITLHNITSVFTKHYFSKMDDIPEIVKEYDLYEPFLSAYDKLISASVLNNDIDCSTMMISWFFSNYENFYNSRELEYLFRRAIDTESSMLVKRMIYSSLQSHVYISDNDRRYYLSKLVTEASKKKGLIFQMKRNGLKSIEEDLFEYNMRLRNVETQDEAILLMRQINSRMSILEDYLREEDLEDEEYKRWESCYKKYLELRDALSKKTVYNRKMYGLFVDYNALQNMSQTGKLMQTYY